MAKEEERINILNRAALGPVNTCQRGSDGSPTCILVLTCFCVGSMSSLGVILVFKDIYVSQSRKWPRHSKMVHMLGKNEKKKMKERKSKTYPLQRLIC